AILENDSLVWTGIHYRRLVILLHNDFRSGTEAQNRITDSKSQVISSRECESGRRVKGVAGMHWIIPEGDWTWAIYFAPCGAERTNEVTIVCVQHAMQVRIGRQNNGRFGLHRQRWRPQGCDQ